MHKFTFDYLTEKGLLKEPLGKDLGLYEYDNKLMVTINGVDVELGELLEDFGSEYMQEHDQGEWGRPDY